MRVVKGKMPNYRANEADLYCRDLLDYSCTFVLFFALCLFAGFKRAYVFCYAKALRTLPASRFCTNIFVFQHVLCHKPLIYLNICLVQFCAIKCKNNLSCILICVKMSLRLRCVSRCEVPVSACPPRRWRGLGARRAGHETLRCRRFKSLRERELLCNSFPQICQAEKRFST